MMSNQQNSQASTPQYYEKQFVAINKDYFYEYSAVVIEKTLYVKIIDQNLQTYNLTFERDNKLYFRASYRNFIIVEQISNQGESVSYWVITIQRQIIDQTYTYVLKSFDVSSTSDNQGYLFKNAYTLSSIIEYRQQTKFLYVIMQARNDTDIYGIDVGNKGGSNKEMIAIGWFYKNSSNPQNILGGNSRVFFQATESLIYIDTNNTRTNDSDPTVYNKKSISQFTSLTIHNISKVFNLVDWYFQYTSLSYDQLQFTGFVFYGYSGQTYGQYSMNSTAQIKYFSDQYNFFMAVGSDDAYLTVVQWDQQKQSYGNWTGMISTLIADQLTQDAIVSILYSASYIAYIDRHFYVLAPLSFYVLDSKLNIYKTRLQQSQITKQYDLIDLTMKEIKDYNEQNNAK